MKKCNDIPADVTVCIATYNAQDFIARTLDSLLSQTHIRFKCVIADDVSTDKTISICSKYEKVDPRISLYSHKKRLGWVGNVNRSLSYVSDTKFMMIFPHDDVIEPTYLDKLIAQLDSNPRAVVAFSDMEVIYTDEAAKTIAYDSLCGVSGSRDRASIALNHEGRVFIAYRGVFRATVHENTGGLRRHWRGEYAADIPWCVKLAINGEFIRIREKLYRKYSTKDGLSSQWKHNSLLNWIAVYCSCFQAIFVSNKPLKICLPLYFRTLLSMFSIVGWRVKRSYQKGFMYTYLNAYYGVCSCVRSIAGDRLWGYLRRVKSYVYPASVPRQH